MKRGKITKAVILLLYVLLLSGCGTKEVNLPAEPTVEPGAGSSSFFSEIEKKEADTVGTVALRGLCETLEKKENAAELAEYNAWNRLKTGDEEDEQSLFCIDETTGVVYFVNQNKDWYLYRLKDGVAEVAVELPTKHVITWKGMVYFIIGDYGTYELGEIKEGDIFAYTPADGSVKQLYAMEAEQSWMHKMMAREDGLYFSYVIQQEEKLKTVNFCLPYGATEPVEDAKRLSNCGWGNYYLTTVSTKGNVRLALISRTESWKDIKELNVGNSSLACIVGDTLYAVKDGGTSTKLAITDLVTGAQEVIDCWDAYYATNPLIVKEREEIDFVFFESFVAVGDTIWAFHTNYIFKIDPESKQIETYRINERIYRMGAFYTDGERLYATYTPSSDRTQQYVVQIMTDQVGEGIYEGLPTLEVKYITE